MTGSNQEKPSGGERTVIEQRKVGEKEKGWRRSFAELQEIEMQMARYSVKPSYLFPRSQSPVSNLTLFTLLFTFLSLLPLVPFPLIPFFFFFFFFYLNSQRSFKNVPFHLSLWHRQPGSSSIFGPFCPREPNCTWRMVLSPALRWRPPRGAAENPPDQRRAELFGKA